MGANGSVCVPLPVGTWRGSLLAWILAWFTVDRVAKRLLLLFPGRSRFFPGVGVFTVWHNPDDSVVPNRNDTLWKGSAGV